MAKNFHENYAAGEIELPSERSTGLVFGAVAAIVALIWRNSPSCCRCLLVWLRRLRAVSPPSAQYCSGRSILPGSKSGFSYTASKPHCDVCHLCTGVCARRGAHADLARPLRSRRMPGAPSYWIERDKSADVQVPWRINFELRAD